ncbi:TetR/AcrR family transcriptional regulator [Streptomyces sp. NPDC055287]
MPDTGSAEGVESAARTKSATPTEATAASEATEDAAKPRRRQARGERRIAQLLDAAANVFVTSGYTAASTNAIAREAGVSPGTLYQFFPNKEAIAVELGGRLLQEWNDSQKGALTPENLALPLPELLDAYLDPLIRFNVENPAFAVLTQAPGSPGQLAQEFNALHSALLARIEGLLAGFLPGTPAADLSRVANMTFAVFQAGLMLVLGHEGTEREGYAAELKTTLQRYLDPVIGDCAFTDTATE